jgi:hypothetical protein
MSARTHTPELYSTSAFAEQGGPAPRRLAPHVIGAAPSPVVLTPARLLTPRAFQASSTISWASKILAIIASG